MPSEIEVKHHRDTDGNHVVSVPLTNSDKTAELFREDFERLMKSGVDPRWKLINGQVFERGKSRLSVKRLIANAKVGEKVMLLDGDAFNLKRSNMGTAPGRALHNTSDKLDYMERPHKLSRVKLKQTVVPPSWETVK